MLAAMSSPSSPLVILTGASRGLGLAMARQVLARPGVRLLTISRQRPALEAPAGATLTCWQADLADPVPLAARLAEWLATQADPVGAPVDLIHNAGVISTPAPLSASADAELSNAIRVGVEAPLVLTAAFLRATAAWQAPRRVCLISSGLGRRAMAGSASYCAAKAGLDHLARALALEEAQAPRGAKVVSLAPGVIDTDMQVQLRGADPALFPERARFAGLHEGGLLDSPDTAAAKVLAYLERADFGADPIGDVRG
jgi:NAD(P)-dependent dehydrogenase (short-subunit alcohol dehydrogenase family)